MPDYVVVRLERVPAPGEMVPAMLHREEAVDEDEATKAAARAANDLQADQNIYAVVLTGNFQVKSVTVRPPDWDVS